MPVFYFWGSPSLCATVECAISSFFELNKQVCQLEVCHLLFFFAAPSWCATVGGVPADVGNCVGPQGPPVRDPDRRGPRALMQEGPPLGPLVPGPSCLLRAQNPFEATPWGAFNGKKFRAARKGGRALGPQLKPVKGVGPLGSQSGPFP